MQHRLGTLSMALAAVLVIATGALGVVIDIGGPGSTSTSPWPYGEQGLLDMGEVATATYEYSVAMNGTTATLWFEVTNTSPAVLGTDSPDVPDAPVISDMFFSVPSGIETVTFISADGVDAASSGWDFTFNPDAAPTNGLGFLSSVFDIWVDGGPPDSPAPVLASVNDPDITDGPGDPLPSPVMFRFTLTFTGGSVPVGFNAGWFVDSIILGSPDYIAAAKFMSGANDGSGTVTDRPPVPVPGSLTLLLVGLCGVGLRCRKSFPSSHTTGEKGGSST